MMQPIAAGDLPRYKPLFPGPELALLLGAVSEGNSVAQGWAGGTRGSGATWALLWDRGNNVLYLGGDVTAADVEPLRSFLAAVVHSEAARAGRPYLRGRGTAAENTRALEEALAPWQPERRARRLYAYCSPDFDPDRFPAVKGVALVPITRAFIEEERPAYVGVVVEEIRQMWPSLEAFYARGFGVAAVADGAMVGWCSTEFMSRDACGVGVETHPEFGRRGIATRAAAHVVAESLRRKLTPYWDCLSDNAPSVRLAEKLGFDLLEETDFLYWKVAD